MIYSNTFPAKFIDRPNRFIAHVEKNGTIETVHVKNTGRCRELLIPGADVMLQKSDNPERKTAYDLISVKKDTLGWVNIDSQVLNRIVYDWLLTQNYDVVKPEFTYGDSRIDFYMEKGMDKYLLEVKGCTLEQDGIGYFPDAPSIRAVKHCHELVAALGEGYKCMIAFVIAMENVTHVMPNTAKGPKFAAALLEAESAGVKILNLQCCVSPTEISIKR